MPVEIVNLAAQTSTHLKLLVYGAPGIGKTFLGCTSKKLRTFVFDVDGGTYTAAAAPEVEKRLITVAKIRSRADASEALGLLQQRAAQVDLAVLDTATELQRMVLKEVLEKRKIDLADQQAWGAVLNVMELFAQGFRSLPMHVLWLAHEVEKEDPETKLSTFRPAFQGAFGGFYSKHFDITARYFMVDEPVKDAAGKTISTRTRRLLNTQRDQRTQAKGRGSALDKFETPDIDQLLGKLIAATTTPKGE